jgi:hypothetical protein
MISWEAFFQLQLNYVLLIACTYSLLLLKRTVSSDFDGLFMILSYSLNVNVVPDYIPFYFCSLHIYILTFKSGGVDPNGAKCSGFCSLYRIFYKIQYSESGWSIQTDKNTLKSHIFCINSQKSSYN